MLGDVITSFTVCLLLSEVRCVEVRFAESRPARAQLYVGSRPYVRMENSTYHVVVYTPSSQQEAQAICYQASNIIPIDTL